MGELPIDHVRLWWADRLARRQDERPSARDGHAAGQLDDTGQGEDTTCEFLDQARIGWLLIELGMRVGRRRLRASANPWRERGRRHRKESMPEGTARGYSAARRADEFVWVVREHERVGEQGEADSCVPR